MFRTLFVLFSVGTISSLAGTLGCAGQAGSGGGSGSTGSGSSGSGSGAAAGSGANGSGSGTAASTGSGGSGSAGSGASGATSGGASPCRADAGTAPISFASQLMPIFQGTCSAGGITCHGDSSVNMKLAPGGSRQYFGPGAPEGGAPPMQTPTQLQMIHDGFVGVKSWDDPTMNVVTPGDPTTSFLWYKLENTQNKFDAACARGQLGYCGLSMPNNTVTLIPQSQRDMICNWIVQGAKNN